VKWIDLRLAFTFRYFKEGTEKPEDSYERMFKVFGEEIEKFKASEEGKEFWGARMIWTGLRVLETRKIIEDMDACLTIKVGLEMNSIGFHWSLTFCSLHILT
jgi:adenosine deaminase CECR1